MKKQNWKKNKKSTASLRKILTALSKDPTGSIWKVGFTIATTHSFNASILDLV